MLRRGLRLLTPQVAAITAMVGMVPAGRDDVNPALNAVQTAVAVWSGDAWRLAVFQNTPAQFHGRPEAAAALTAELRAALERSQRTAQGG